jgi:hypothetical protein
MRADDEMTTSTIIPRGARMNGPGWLTYYLDGLRPSRSA